MTTLADIARVEAAIDVERGLYEGAGDALDKHGDDPESPAILLTGFRQAIERIDRGLVPGFAAALRDLLAQEAA